MNGDSPNVYQFDEFRLDTDIPALYHRDTLIDAGSKKMLQVLAAFLRNPNTLVAHYEVLNEVWGNEHFDVTSDNVNEYVSQIRTVLAKCAPDLEYFTNKKGRGYIFTCEVKSDNRQIPPPDIESEISQSEDSVKTSRHFSRFAVAVTTMAALIFLLGAWMLYPNNDIEEVKRVVRDSQMYESLVLYKSPTLFKEADLDQYWTSELDNKSNYDRPRIRMAVNKMVDEGRHYGEESKNEQFEFQNIDIDTTGEIAVVKTLEKWFVAVYHTDGTLLRNRTIGPYFVSYIVRKIDGRWLIEKSTTGRVNRPIPRLTEIEANDEIKAGQQFFVKISGQDFEIETVFIEAVGPGCPEGKACKVTNASLRENSKLAVTALDNVPMTLSSGNFKIVAYNGESQPSNPLYLTVP